MKEKNTLPMRAVWELPMRAIDTTNKKKLPKLYILL